MGASAIYTHTAGTLDASTYLLTTGGGSRTLTAGTLRVGAATWGANYSFTPTPAAGFTIEYYNTTPTINGSITYQNLTFSGSGTTANPSTNLIIQGNLANTGGGTLNFSARNVTLSGTVAAPSIAGFTTTGTVSMTKTGGTATFAGNVNGGPLTINGAGGTLNLGTGLTHTFTGTWTRTNGTLNGGSSTLNLGGNVSGTSGTFTAGTSTVNYTGAAQTAAVVTYNNLTVSGSGAKTFATTPTVNGILSMEGTATITVTTGVVTYGAAATLQYNTATARNASSEEWITTFAGSGGVIIANTGTITMDAAKVVNAPLTINSGASLNTGNFALTFGGNFSNSGGTFTAGSSNITISGTGTQSISGFTTTGTVSMTKTGGTATFQGNVNGGALTINGAGGTLNLGTGLTHTFTGTWTRTNGTLNAGSCTLNLGGSVSGTGGTFTAGTSTVNYTAAGPQTVAGVTYNNLTLSGSGAKTTTGVTVNGVLSMEGTATASAEPTYGAAATLQYKGTGAQSTGAEFPATWSGSGGVIIDNAAGVSLNASRTVNTTFTLTSGIVATGVNTLTIGAGGSVSGAGSSKYIYGNLQKNVATGSDVTRTFEVGTASGYDPVTLVFASVSVAGNLTVKATAGDHPNLGTSTIDSTKCVNVYWTLTNSGTTFTNYGATVTFRNPEDIDAGADPTKFIVGLYSGSTWSYPTVGTKTTTSTQATGMTSVGDIAVGEGQVQITNAPGSYDFGTVAAGTTKSSGLTTFQVTNNSSVAVNITISGTDMTGGNTWTLSDAAAPGSMICGFKAGLFGGSYNVIVKKNGPYNTLVAALGSGLSQQWGLQLLAPTNYTDGATKTGTVTITAAAA
jgi:hypothetical protein